MALCQFQARALKRPGNSHLCTLGSPVPPHKKSGYSAVEATRGGEALGDRERDRGPAVSVQPPGDRLQLQEMPAEPPC